MGDATCILAAARLPDRVHRYGPVASPIPHPSPPRVSVVPDTEAAGSYAIEIDGQPLLTRHSEDFCRRVAYHYNNPRFGEETFDPARVCAENIRRWSLS